jgi:hypothetical protein
MGKAEQRARAPAATVTQPANEAEGAFAPAALDERGRDREAEHATVG